MVKKIKQTNINKVKSELRKKFWWFVEFADRDLPEHYYKLSTPTLIRESYDYLEGKDELYVLSSNKFLFRRTTGNGNPILILIGIELLTDYSHYAEYIYAIAGYDNDYVDLIDLDEYYRIYAEDNNEEDK
jgi:hypothetical protein